MKRLLVILVTLGMIQQADAQIKVRAGLEGGFNTTWLFNKQVSDAGDNLDYKTSFGGQIGIGGFVKLNNIIGVSVAVMSGHINQKYTVRTNPGGALNETFTIEDKLGYIDIPLLFRLVTPGKAGFYFEIGPQFGLLQKAKESSTQSIGGYDDLNVKSNFNSSNISGILGFGVDAKAGPVTITAGLRFGYGLTDAAKNYSNASNYETTHSAVGGVHLGVAYVFGGND